jgi:hypothetical protein
MAAYGEFELAAVTHVPRPDGADMTQLPAADSGAGRFLHPPGGGMRVGAISSWSGRWWLPGRATRSSSGGRGRVETTSALLLRPWSRHRHHVPRRNSVVHTDLQL